VALLLTPGEVHFLDPLRRTRRRGLLVREHGDAIVEVMIQAGCGPTHMDTNLGHPIQGWVGASSMEHGSVDGHGDVWGCVVVCWTVLSSGSVSHRIEYMQGVTGTVT